MSVTGIVFFSLVLDLFAFTIPLPLFPRIIEWYTKREASNPHGLLSRTLQTVSVLRSTVYNASSMTNNRNLARWDVVLLGGLMGSLFSTLQFIVSPVIGSLSDSYGRKTVLLWTMAGNVLSAAVWIKSTTWASYLLSRAIGGISEGNVQLATAILSDVTPPERRTRSLALIGMAFSICFCIGPPIGAYFASRPLPQTLVLSGIELNIYATPAFITLILLLVETLFLAIALPETRGIRPTDETVAKKDGKTNNARPKRTIKQRLATLKAAKFAHFGFLSVFSGIEFTLTFLTYDLFDWSNSQNGRLLATIGIMAALLQGGYSRRVTSKIGEGVMAQRGMYACSFGFALLASLPHLEVSTTAPKVIYGAAACLAFTSATVVSSLTALASLQCDDVPITGVNIKASQELAKGRALGSFRSAGQLGRALGPLLASASYWTFGPSLTYSTAAASMLAIAIVMKPLARKL